MCAFIQSVTAWPHNTLANFPFFRQVLLFGTQQLPVLNTIFPAGSLAAWPPAGIKLLIQVGVQPIAEGFTVRLLPGNPSTIAPELFNVLWMISKAV